MNKKKPEKKEGQEIKYELLMLEKRFNYKISTISFQFCFFFCAIFRCFWEAFKNKTQKKKQFFYVENNTNTVLTGSKFCDLRASDNSDEQTKNTTYTLTYKHTYIVHSKIRPLERIENVVFELRRNKK